MLLLSSMVTASNLGSLALIFFAARASGSTLHEAHVEPSFIEFVQRHSKPYQAATPEYHQRLELFRRRVSAVRRQNSLPGRLWTAGVNKLADRTEEELASIRGYRHHSRPEGARSSKLGFLQLSRRSMSIEHLPEDFSWQSHLQAMQDVRDQGSCGSCWAFASATVLRAHSELYQVDRNFSQQQLVDCTPNPRHCGGDGGCKGATSEPSRREWVLV
jgi:cathepsin L